MKYILTIVYLCLTIIGFPQLETDSLEILIEQKKGTEKVDFLNEVSSDFWASEPQKGLDYATQSYKIAQELNYKKGIGWALNGIGLNYLGQSSFSKSTNALNEAILIFKEIQDSSGLARAFGIKAIVCRKTGDYDQALENSLNSLKIYEDGNDDKGKAIALNNVANIYINLDNYDKALEYYNRSSEIIKQLGDKNYYAGTLNNMGVVYQRLNENEKALEYYEKVLTIRKETKNKLGIATSLNNIGTINEDIGNYSEALNYFQQALIIKKEIGDRSGMAITYNNIGSVSLKLNKYKKALDALGKGQKIAEEINAKDILSDTYSHLSELNRLQKKYKQALEFSMLYSDLQDSIYNDKSSRQLAEVQTKYETEKKEKENILLQQNNEIQRLEIKNQKSLIKFFIVLSILVVSLVVFILLLLLTNRQTTKLLKEKNSVITEQKNQLKETLSELEEAVATKNKFFSIIAHDLKNPFNTILGLSNLLKDNYADFSDEERRKFIGEILKSSQNTYRLLENLLTWANIQQHRIEINKESINLKNLVDESISFYLMNAHLKKITVKNDIAKEVKIYADRFTVSTAITNLISNSIKFTPYEGKVLINTIQNNSHIDINIQDTGIGMSNELIKKLFCIDESFSTAGTNNEMGTGLGLVLCKEFVELNNGKIVVESEEGKGSRFTIRLKIV